MVTPHPPIILTPVLLNNAATELTKQVTFVNDSSATKISNLIAKNCDSDNALNLTKAVVKSFQDLIYQKDACFFIQNLFQNISRSIHNQDSNSVEKSQFDSILLKILHLFQSNVSEYSSNVYSSHVIREFMCLLAGIKYEETLISSRYPVYQHCMFFSLICCFLLANVVQLGPPSRICLRYLNLLTNRFSKDNIIGLKLGMFILDVICSDIGCPTVFLLVRVINLRIPRKAIKFSCSLMEEMVKLDSTWATTTGTDQPYLATIATDRRLSRIIEVILEANSTQIDFYEQIYKKCFEHNCSQYALHSVANYVLQTFISLSPKLDSVKLVDNELLNDCNDYKHILDVGHVGILVQLSFRYAHLNNLDSEQDLESLQQEFLKRLGRLFESEINSPAFLCSLLAMKQTNASLPFSVSYCGSQVVQNLLRFKNPSIIVSCLLALESDDLRTLCCHQCGSYIIEAYFSSKTILKKLPLLKRLKKLLGFLVDDKIGSRLVDYLWSWASLKRKRLIAGALLDGCTYEKLKRGSYSKYFARKAGLEHFNKRNELWNSIVSTNSGQKRSMFKDIL